MIRYVFLSILGIVMGVMVSYLVLDYSPVHNYFSEVRLLSSPTKEIVGFLPYWLLDKAQEDYSQYITQLSYYGLTLDSDGTILVANEAGEAEPGYHALRSGLLDTHFASAKRNNISLSLLLFLGDNDTINSLISDPTTHATNTLRDILPLMRKYGFSDLNIDIESTGEASSEARAHFVSYIREIKRGIDMARVGTVSFDISPDNILRNSLVDLPAVAPFLSKIIIMGYDFHYPGSYVTGAVGPLYGASQTFEYDTQTAVKLAKNIFPPEKIIVGIPLYGYEWETITAVPRSAVIPGTGFIASNKRVEELLLTCATCSAQFDSTAEESFIVYNDPVTGTYHQLYYPDERSTQAKIDFVTKKHLGGVAMWALGYEGSTILQPLKGYK